MTNLVIVVSSIIAAAAISGAAWWLAGWLSRGDRASFVYGPTPTPPEKCFTRWGLTTCPGRKRCFSMCAVENVVVSIESGRAVEPTPDEKERFRSMVQDAEVNAKFVPVVARVRVGTVDPVRAALHDWDDR